MRHCRRPARSKGAWWRRRPTRIYPCRCRCRRRRVARLSGRQCGRRQPRRSTPCVVGAVAARRTCRDERRGPGGALVDVHAVVVVGCHQRRRCLEHDHRAIGRCAEAVRVIVAVGIFRARGHQGGNAICALVYILATRRAHAARVGVRAHQWLCRLEHDTRTITGDVIRAACVVESVRGGRTGRDQGRRRSAFLSYRSEHPTPGSSVH